MPSSSAHIDSECSNLNGACMPVCSSVSDSNLKSELATGTASVSELEVERCRSRRDRDGVDVDGSY